MHSKRLRRDYVEAVRRLSDDRFVTCTKCKTKQLEKKDSDAYVCGKRSKVFIDTDPIRKTIRGGLKSGAIEIIDKKKDRRERKSG